ncbi:uncharacterized protein LOC106473973 [Limulus polyphemus]|uniref:Uncharacterized protein LOC106473973 n=1 Tax=Limulus polyphemus TaxID=6850 RepID=A0ABM1TQA2_LIMPO|nr:uncharacterized protein LOC106473973 [Limulus polyphemus]XP_022258059.1 uncharacterized protein LOC106473973 [Limulus polyphemus]
MYRFIGTRLTLLGLRFSVKPRLRQLGILKMANIVEVLSCLIKSLENAVAEVGNVAEDVAANFVRKQLGEVGMRLMSSYGQCFEDAGVNTRSGLEDQVRKQYRNEEVRDALEYLEDMEEKWNTCLKKLDSITKQHRFGTVSEDVSLSFLFNLDVVKANTEKVTNLQQYVDKGFSSLLLILLRHFA